MDAFPTDREAKRRALLDAVERARPAVEAGIPAAESGSTLASAAVEAMQDAGLFRLKMPAELGGADADPCTQMDVIEAMTMVYPSAGWVLMTNATAIGNAGAFLPDEGIEEVFGCGRIPRAATVGGVSSRIEPVDGGFLLTGRWPFCSGVPHSQYICLGARLLLRGRRRGRDAHLLRPHRRRDDSRQLARLRPQGLRQQRRLRRPRLRAGAHDLGALRPRCAACAAAAAPSSSSACPAPSPTSTRPSPSASARLALETVKDVAKSKRRGRGAAAVTLADRQTFQRFVASAELKLRAARLVTYEAHERAWQAVSAGDTPDPELEAELRATAVLSTEVAVEIATQAFRFAGGAALHVEDRLQMCMNDANAGAQHLAVSDVAYENYGQFLLDLPEANAYY